MRKGNPKKTEVFVVNQFRGEKGQIVSKSLTPNKLDLTGKIFPDAQSIVSQLNETLKNKIKDQKLAEALDSLDEDILKGSKKKFEKVSDITEFSEDVTLSEKTVSLLNRFSPADVNIIGKDYGEALGAIVILNSVEKVDVGVEFPAAANNPLTDFTIDGYNISAKYAGGAAATLTSIIKGIDKKQLTTPAQKSLYKIFQYVVFHGVSDSYIEIAKAMKLEALDLLASEMKTNSQSINKEAINSYVSKVVSKGKDNKQKTDLLLKSAVGRFYKFIGRGPNIDKIDWNQLNPKSYYGLVTSPLSNHVVDKLNENNAYVKALTELLSKIEVKQMYLDFRISKKTASFNLKNFSSPKANFKFESGLSVYNPENKKLSFKLI